MFDYRLAEQRYSFHQSAYILKNAVQPWIAHLIYDFEWAKLIYKNRRDFLFGFRLFIIFLIEFFWIIGYIFLVIDNTNAVFNKIVDNEFEIIVFGRYIGSVSQPETEQELVDIFFVLFFLV